MMSKFYFKPISILIIIAILMACNNTHKTKEEVSMNNLLFNGFNEAKDFSKIDTKVIKEAVQLTIKKAKKSLDIIVKIDDSKRNFDNTMLALDNLFNDIYNCSGSIYLIGYTHPDSATRVEALKGISEIDKFNNELSLNENLYKAVKAYSITNQAKELDGYKKIFTEKTVANFEREGLGLSVDKRDQLKQIKDKISDIGIKFSSNISDYKDELIVSEVEIEGLPDDYKLDRKMADGKYKIDLTYPSYIPFMKYSVSDNARKQLYMKFQNRAAEQNLDILKELLSYRKKMAELLGYKSYANYRLDNKMAKNPETVWSFENDMKANLIAKKDKDFAELLEVKRQTLNDNSISTIASYESSYYNNILMKEKYELDNEKIKEYFELDNVINGLFKISQHLFNVKFNEVDNSKAWHKDVRCFEIEKDGKLSGRFYLDLFPRDNKYGHAASFPMINGKQTDRGYQIPVNSLVCNFPKPSNEKPSLLTHNDVVTFFHEFGHLLHAQLTTANLVSMSGTSVAKDFVETPSQLYENWAWNYDALKLFAKHYDTGEILPEKLYKKMLATKNVGSGLATIQQVFYGTLDMTLHDKFDPDGDVSTTDIVKKLQNELTPFKYVDDCHFEASFGHLNGYGSGYYSYLWAKVYSEDIFSVFENNGIMDQSTGIRFRDIILANGSSVNEYELVKEFLQREPNQDAFLKSLGL